MALSDTEQDELERRERRSRRAATDARNEAGSLQGALDEAESERESLRAGAAELEVQLKAEEEVHRETGLERNDLSARCERLESERLAIRDALHAGPAESTLAAVVDAVAELRSTRERSVSAEQRAASLQAEVERVTRERDALEVQAEEAKLLASIRLGSMEELRKALAEAERKREELLAKHTALEAAWADTCE